MADRKSVPEILYDKKLGTTADNVNRVARSSSVGSIDTAIGDTLYGINHRLTPGAVQVNKDIAGLTFFTKPEMNMTTANIENIRQMIPLLNLDSYSLARVIRAYLDPSLQRTDNTLPCPLVDHQLPFIPLLTNNLLSLNGWPDFMLPTYTSQPGTQEETFSLVDGVNSLYGTYDLTATFRNLPGDPITALFHIWCLYAEAVAIGKIIPYLDHILQNRIDYSLCIWRLTLDQSKRFVQKIGRTGGAFPVNTPLGAAFNFDSAKPISDINDQITINFKAIGASYQDPILIYEFNETVNRANPAMGDTNKRKSNFKLMPPEAGNLLNNKGYPRINSDTYELEWWIPNDVWKQYFGEVEAQSKVGLRNERSIQGI